MTLWRPLKRSHWVITLAASSLALVLGVVELRQATATAFDQEYQGLERTRAAAHLAVYAGQCTHDLRRVVTFFNRVAKARRAGLLSLDHELRLFYDPIRWLAAWSNVAFQACAPHDRYLFLELRRESGVLLQARLRELAENPHCQPPKPCFVADTLELYREPDRTRRWL